MTTTRHDLMVGLRHRVRPCDGGCRTGDARVTCVADTHLFPPALDGGVTYPAYVTRSGAVFHARPDCPSLQGRTPRLDRVTWLHLSSNRCRTCFAEPPAEVTAARGEAKRVTGALRVIRDASLTWPGRLPTDSVEPVRRAKERLSKSRLRDLAGLAETAIRVADILLETVSDAWSPPPTPTRVLGAAVAAMLGVNDDPWFRSGQRPRTAVDAAAAAAASSEALEGAWKQWSYAAEARGLGNAAAAVHPANKRPAHVRALRDLVAAWSAAGSELAAQGHPQVISLPEDNRGRGTAQASIDALSSGAVLHDARFFLTVVPQVVADWFSRTDTQLFEVIGPWPGDDIGVRVLERLVKLSGADPYQMPALLPVAVDLVREEAAPAA